MFTISKEFHFSASHRLNGLADGHPCGRTHGHNYIVRVVLSSDRVNAQGFVQDYGDLKPIATYIDEHLDHRDLNEVFPFNPTVELMAQYLFNEWHEQFPKLIAVDMSETPKTWCRYSAT